MLLRRRGRRRWRSGGAAARRSPDPWPLPELVGAGGGVIAAFAVPSATTVPAARPSWSCRSVRVRPVIVSATAPLVAVRCDASTSSVPQSASGRVAPVSRWTWWPSTTRPWIAAARQVVDGAVGAGGKRGRRHELAHPHGPAEQPDMAHDRARLGGRARALVLGGRRLRPARADGYRVAVGAGDRCGAERHREARSLRAPRPARAPPRPRRTRAPAAHRRPAQIPPRRTPQRQSPPQRVPTTSDPTIARTDLRCLPRTA